MTTKTEALKQARARLDALGTAVDNLDSSAGISGLAYLNETFMKLDGAMSVLERIDDCAEPEPEWLPIDSAPKDGTSVLGYGEPAGEIHGPSGVMTIESMVWSSSRTDFPGYEWVIAGDGYANWFKPTHWQPLPKAPA